MFSSFICHQCHRKYTVSYATCAVLPPEHIWTAQASILRQLKLEKRLLHPRRCVSSRRHPPLEHTFEPLGPSRLSLALHLVYSFAELHRDSSLDNICVLELGGQFRITSRGRKTRQSPHAGESAQCSNLPGPRVPTPIGTRCTGSDFSTY